MVSNCELVLEPYFKNLTMAVKYHTHGPVPLLAPSIPEGSAFLVESSMERHSVCYYVAESHRAIDKVGEFFPLASWAPTTRCVHSRISNCRRVTDGRRIVDRRLYYPIIQEVYFDNTY